MICNSNDLRAALVVPSNSIAMYLTMKRAAASQDGIAACIIGTSFIEVKYTKGARWNRFVLLVEDITDSDRAGAFISYNNLVQVLREVC